MRKLDWMLYGAVLAIAVAGCGAPEPPAAPEPAEEMPAADACAPVGEIQFICDMISPEDLAVLPGEEWVIASGNQEGGMIHLVSVRDKTSSVLYPTAAPREQLDAATYPDCPGPIDPGEGAAFRAHGLYLKPDDGGVHTVYMVHHGFRESVEVYEVDGNANPPELTWVGCAVAPDGLTLNSVVALPDGGFAATSFRTAGLAESIDEILTGTISGSVWEWRTADGWTEVPGSATGGPNGLEISADGEWVLHRRLGRAALHPAVARPRSRRAGRRRPALPARQPADAAGWIRLRRRRRPLQHAGRDVPRRAGRPADPRGDTDHRPPRDREVRGLHRGHSNRRRDLDGHQPRREDRLLPRPVAAGGCVASLIGAK